MNLKIIDLLMIGKIDEVKDLITNIEVLPKGIEEWSYKTHNITLYTLAASILIKHEGAAEHGWASYLMAMPLCAYNGAYSVGLFHARRASELEPKNIEYKRFMILFHDIPEQLVDKEEAIKIAQEVLQEDPECGVSLNVLERYGIQR
ncbi:MAG: hypothetical protein AB7F19_03480 [Candidatus Babeliales bacterium]